MIKTHLIGQDVRMSASHWLPDDLYGWNVWSSSYGVWCYNQSSINNQISRFLPPRSNVPHDEQKCWNVAENGTKVNYFQSPRFLFIIGHWSMNQTYYCETRFPDSHDVLSWQVMDSPGMFTNNIGYKVLSESSLTGFLQGPPLPPDPHPWLRP